jgi:hypothetical protein
VVQLVVRAVGAAVVLLQTQFQVMQYHKMVVREVRVVLQVMVE